MATLGWPWLFSCGKTCPRPLHVALSLKRSRIVDEDVWDEDDGEEDEETTIPCPYCRRPIYEDAPRCPYCENYIVEEDAASRRKPWWIIIGTLLVFYVVYRWIAG